MMQLRVNGDRSNIVWLEKPTYLIGQSAACNIRLSDERLQPVHACLKVEGDRVKLLRQDEAQISVNGYPLEAEAWVSDGDTIGLGSTQLMVVKPEPDEQPAEHKPADDEWRPEGSAESGVDSESPEDDPAEGWVLRGISPALGGSTYLVKGKALVGRARDCDIQLGEAHLSRHHAELTPTPEGLELNDLSSSNGSFVNGRRVMQAAVKNGDEISFDTLKFRVFHTAASRQDEQTSIRSATPEFRVPPRHNSGPTAIEVQHATLQRMRGQRNEFAAGTPAAGAYDEGAENEKTGGARGSWLGATLTVLILAGVVWGATIFFQPALFD